MHLVRNGISRRDAGVGAGGMLISAVLASFVLLMMSGPVHALGLVEYFGEKVLYVPLTEIGSPHHWTFELQNNGDTPVNVAILVNSPLVYVKDQMVQVQQFSSKQVTFTVYLPPDVHYAVGDFADVSFEVAYAQQTTGKSVVLRKGLSGYMGVMVGSKGQEPLRDIMGMLAATGKPMDTLRLASNEMGADFYKPVAVTQLPVPPPENPPFQNGGNLMLYIVGSVSIIMLVGVLLYFRNRSGSPPKMKGSALLLAALMMFVVMPSVLADSGAGYTVSAEILEEMPMAQLMIGAGQGISGMLVGMTDPLVMFMLALGVVAGILIIFYGFAEGIKNALFGATTESLGKSDEF